MLCLWYNDPLWTKESLARLLPLKRDSTSINGAIDNSCHWMQYCSLEKDSVDWQKKIAMLKSELASRIWKISTNYVLTTYFLQTFVFCKFSLKIIVYFWAVSDGGRDGGRGEGGGHLGALLYSWSLWHRHWSKSFLFESWGRAVQRLDVNVTGPWM